MLGVEGAGGGEGNGVVAKKHGGVVAEEKRRYGGDREDRHSDHAAGLDAGVGFHFLEAI